MNIKNKILYPASVFVALYISGYLTAPAFSAEMTTPNQVYAKVNQITDRLSQIYKKNLGTLSGIKIPRELQGRTYLPRHVFQRILDIERQTTSLLKLHSLKPKPVTVITIKKYTPDSVMALANSINLLVGRVRSAIGMPDTDKATEKLSGKEPINVYASLDRIEALLFRIGTSTIPPPDVLRRAKIIVYMVENFCEIKKCDKVEKITPSEIGLIWPIKVYAEAYKLIIALNNVEKNLTHRIAGGVLAPTLESGLITPIIVHKVTGIILADLIEMHHLNSNLQALNIPYETGKVLPIDVWREINYARRLAVNLATKM